ncbi:oligosaccharide flippase family protein [Photobacterium sp. CAU 1568]|uniref:Oligosaccharide flippase family protein n=1 Tax=Photobacterium arenosum TaxID=2774143 RepID=A0ABR9BQY5_9GAMM|nr:oligosaccharide flippase family protein [Photobacterium arenosum]MBD8513997.1 oligosaccharide flippase family protein [Photobacterium arenosum]
MRSSPVNSHSDYLKSGSLILFFSLGLGFIADYLFNLTLSQALSSHEYGDYKVAYAFATLTSMIILLGGDRVAPRVLSGAIENKDRHYIVSFLLFYGGIAMLFSAFVILATYLGGVLHLGKTDVLGHHPLMIITFVIPLIAIGALFSRVLQSAKLLAASNLPWRIALPAIKTCLLLLLMSAISEVEYWHVIVTGGFTVAAIVIWQWHKIRQLDLISADHCRTNVLEKRRLLSLSVPMMLAMLVTMALNQIDLFMLEILADEQDVGHFAAAATTAHLLPVAQVTIAGLFLPLIGPALDDCPDSAKALFLQAQRLIVIVTVILTAAVLAVGPWLLTFFGDDFAQAALSLNVLTAAYSVWAMSAFASTWLQYNGKGRQVMIIGVLTLLTDTLANLWLIPELGMTGAAMATCLAMFVASALTWYQLLIMNTGKSPLQIPR